MDLFSYCYVITVIFSDYSLVEEIVFSYKLIMVFNNYFRSVVSMRNLHSPTVSKFVSVIHPEIINN